VQKEVIKKACPDRKAHLVFVLASRETLPPGPAFLSCKSGGPGVMKETIGTLTLACSYRGYPASGRDQGLLVGLLRKHRLSFRDESEVLPFRSISSNINQTVFPKCEEEPLFDDHCRFRSNL